MLNISQKSIAPTWKTSRKALWAASIAVIVLLNGCAAATREDRRSVGTAIDDQNIELQVIDRIFSSELIGEESHIKVEAYEGVVLLMGETTDEERRDLAGKLAGEVNMVKRVVNEIVVAPNATMGQRANNTWLTFKVNTALVKNNPIPGFDATRINVSSSQGTIYLMGAVTHKEGDAVADVVRNVSGVKKVVKVFEYVD